MAGQDEIIYGRNPVLEVIKAGKRRIDVLRLSQGAEVRGTLSELLDLARSRAIRIEKVQRSDLDQLGVNHQGVAASVSPYPYATLGEVMEQAPPAGMKSLVLLLDTLQDLADAMNLALAEKPG